MPRLNLLIKLNPLIKYVQFKIISSFEIRLYYLSWQLKLNYMILMLVAVLALIVYAVLAGYAYTKTRKIIKYYKEAYPRFQNLPQQWEAITRHDKHKWDQKQILFGCFFRFPFKIFIVIHYIAFCFVILVVTLPFGSSTSNKVLRIYGRNYGTFIFGLIFAMTEPSGIKNTIIKTPIVISNHVCSIDILYLINTFYPISFLSKAIIAKVPVIGAITTNAQSIYIERNDEQARSKIVHDIKERVKTFTEYASKSLYQNVFPLIIFPEGTTSNGSSLLKFKLGAFNDLSPLTIVALKYTCDNYDVGMVQITEIQHCIITLCLKVKLDVSMAQIEPLKNEKPQDYCERAQQKLQSMTGFKRYKIGYREREQLKKMIKQKISQQKKQQKSS